jgi:hypothetical protein
MTVLVYEDVELRKGSIDSPLDTAREALVKFIEANRSIVDDGICLRFCLHQKVATKTRASSVANSQALRRLFSVKGAKKTWEADKEGHKYDFNFETDTFAWDGDLLHLTSLEQLVLYQVLVLGQSKPALLPQVKNKLVKKFGKDFLKGLI